MTSSTEHRATSLPKADESVLQAAAAALPQAADRQALITLVEHYFRAVDSKNLAGVLGCFLPDARFSIPTHELVFEGRDQQIAGMFERLFARYQGIWHGDFVHIVEAPHLIASQFRVRNTSFSGELFFKRNANVFRLQDGHFAEVSVYMAGDNSLT